MVSGHKPLVLDGHTAAWASWWPAARRGCAPSGSTSPRGRDGSGRGGPARGVPTLDPTRKAARLVLDEARVVPLGPAGRPGRPLAPGARRRGGGLASELTGVADRALEEATEYAKQRVVFDRRWPPPSGKSPDRRHVHGLEMARSRVQFAPLGLGHRDPTA